MFRFPWGDMHSLNLGWFLQKFNELREDWATAEANIDGALDAEIEKAEDALSDVFDARDAAAASATAAAGSATAAGTSATSAQNSATAAASSATLANQKATAAGLSEAAAAQSATAASSSATAAAGSATTASNAATNAAASETAAGQSASAAAASAASIEGDADAAAASAAAAAQSAEDAETAAESAAGVVAIADFINKHWPSRVPLSDLLTGTYLSGNLVINKNIFSFPNGTVTGVSQNFSLNGTNFSAANTPPPANRITPLEGYVSLIIKVNKGKLTRVPGSSGIARAYFIDSAANTLFVWLATDQINAGESCAGYSSAALPAGNYGIAIQFPDGYTTIDPGTELEIDIGYNQIGTNNIVQSIRPIQLTNSEPEETETI